MQLPSPRLAFSREGPMLWTPLSHPRVLVPVLLDLNTCQVYLLPSPNLKGTFWSVFKELARGEPKADRREMLAGHWSGQQRRKGWRPLRLPVTPWRGVSLPLLGLCQFLHLQISTFSVCNQIRHQHLRRVLSSF